jgi:hypothetical protein
MGGQLVARFGRYWPSSACLISEFRIGKQTLIEAILGQPI